MQRHIPTRTEGASMRELPFNNHKGKNSARRRKSLSKKRSHLETLEVRAVMAGDIIISEFMADNQAINGLKDEDNTLQDWIEIHNTTLAPINLDHWFLTDESANLPKWEFPNVTIPADGFMVIFASDKD